MSLDKSSEVFRRGLGLTNKVGQAGLRIVAEKCGDLSPVDQVICLTVAQLAAVAGTHQGMFGTPGDERDVDNTIAIVRRLLAVLRDAMNNPTLTDLDRFSGVVDRN